MSGSTTPPHVEDRIVALLGRTAMLTAENRILRDDLGRLMLALGLDPELDGVGEGISVAEALMAFYSDSLPDDP